MRLAIVAALAMVVACGGSEKKVEDPGGGDVDEEIEEDDGSSDVMVSQEVLDGIRRVFERKVSIIARCWSRAEEAGELNKNDKVIVTVSTTIQPDGTATGTNITKADTGSETLKSCVVEMVSSWQFPAPPENLPFSHVYSLGEF